MTMLCEDVMIDGELLLLNENGDISNRQTGNGVMTKAVRGTLSVSESRNLVFVMWDLITLTDFQKGKSKIPYKDRFGFLNNLYLSADEHSSDHIEIVESTEVNSLKEAEELFKKALDDGFEGIILKDPKAGFENKRVKHQIKFKAENTADLEITGIIRGTGKNENRMGALECKTSDGRLFTGVGTGFSDTERDWFWSNKDTLLGKIIEVGYNDIIEDKNNDVKSLFLPVFKSLRDDKNLANSLEELK